MKKPPIVAIDGPAGSGKSTLAKLLAKRLNFVHIDSGALYRGVAYLALQKKVSIAEEQSVLSCVGKTKFEFRWIDGANQLHLDGVNVGGQIRTEEVSAASSKVSAFPGVRALLLGLQRSLGDSGGVVMEGRDIGTVVFPQAEVKIFLTASLEARAQRRSAELQAKGQSVDFDLVMKEMAQRDKQDSERAIAPLKKAEDAKLVDTSGMSIDSVLDRLESIVRDAY